MLRIIAVVLVALIPSLVGLWFIQQSKQRFQSRLRQIRFSTVHPSIVGNHLTSIHLEGRPYFIGDISCRFNARSPYLRCATNPTGPCEGCSCYESRTSQSPYLENNDSFSI